MGKDLGKTQEFLGCLWDFTFLELDIGSQQYRLNVIGVPDDDFLQEGRAFLKPVLGEGKLGEVDPGRQIIRRLVRELFENLHRLIGGAGFQLEFGVFQPPGGAGRGKFGPGFKGRVGASQIVAQPIQGPQSGVRRGKLGIECQRLV